MLKTSKHCQDPMIFEDLQSNQHYNFFQSIQMCSNQQNKAGAKDTARGLARISKALAARIAHYPYTALTGGSGPRSPETYSPMSFVQNDYILIRITTTK